MQDGRTEAQFDTYTLMNRVLVDGANIEPFFATGLRHPNARTINDISEDIISGDHIAVRKDGEAAWHHGIYIGDSAVIDLWGPDKETATIAKRGILEFLGAGKGYADFVVIDYDEEDVESGTVFPREISANLARCAVNIAERTQPKYHLLQNNCEGFASFCRCGRCDCLAVRDALSRVKTVARPRGLK